jgi:nucleoside-diphosphate-sugar epimerase
MRSDPVATDGRALITGATGFLGGWLARRLVAAGWKVDLVVRPQSSIKRLTGLNAVVHVDDGLTPMHELVTAAAPDVCFHLAGYFIGTHTDSDIRRLVNDNVLFGTRLVDALSARGECRLVNLGTNWQNAGDESYHPAALYAATKQAFQDILQFYSEADRLKVATLKLFETYGPSDPRPKIVNLLLRAAATGRPLPVSPGEQLIDLVHVDDVASACVAAAGDLARNPQRSQQVYAVSSGAPVRLRKLVRDIEGIIGREVPVEWGKRSYRKREMFEPWDIAPAVPSWSPTVSLVEGIRGAWESLGRRRTPKDVIPLRRAHEGRVT